MSAGSVRRGVLLAAAVLAAGLLAGCGKKAGLAPPEGAEALYSYPRDYPAAGAYRPRVPLPPEESEPSTLSIFPETRTTRTRTY